MIVRHGRILRRPQIRAVIPPIRGDRTLPDSFDARMIAARLDRLPSSPALWAWITRLSVAGFFEVYETALTAVMAPALVAIGIFRAGEDGLFGLPDLASFGFATFAGLFLGALIFSVLADRLGRRPIFTVSLLWYAAAGIIMGLQTDPAALCAWRFIAAIGMGAEVVAIDSYLSELTPKAMRGRGFAISKAMQFAGVPVAGILALLLLHRTVMGIEGWRWMAFFPAIGAVLVWWLRRGLPESPRWLAEHGRTREAIRILAALEAKIQARTDRLFPDALPPADNASPTPGRFSDLCRPPLLPRVLLMFVVSSSITIAYFGFGNWLPSILQAQGADISKSLAYSAAIAIAFPVAPLVFSLFADKVERKWQIVAGAAVSVLGGLLFSVQHAAFGRIACALVITTANNLAASATHTYRSELFPTSVRARAVGLIYATDRMVAAGNSYIVGFVLIRFGVEGVMAFLVGASLLGIAAVALLGPRSNGLAAEEIGGASPRTQSKPLALSLRPAGGDKND